MATQTATSSNPIDWAYVPYRPRVHRISTDLWYPWVMGYRRPLFWQEWWQPARQVYPPPVPPG